MTAERWSVAMSSFTGTPKQADLIITLMGKRRKLRDGAHAERVRAEVLAMPQAEVAKWINTMNAELGFSRRHAPASDAQLLLIGKLEAQLMGASTTTWQDRLTFDEADTRIKRLLRDLKALTPGERTWR